MAVDNRHHVRTSLVNLTMDIPLHDRRARVSLDWPAIQVELDDIGRCYEGRRQRTGHDIAVRIAIMPDAYVSICVENSLRSQDPVRRNKVLDETRAGGTCRRGLPRRLRALCT